MKGTKAKKYRLLILLLLLAITGIVYMGTEGFVIKEITVLGNENIAKEDIVKRAGIPIKQNIFKFNKELTKERIESDPYLEVLSIDPKYPDEIVIEVREKKPSAVIPYLNSYFIIDEKCFIMEIINEPENIEYPLVQDLEIRNFTVGGKLSTSEEYQTKVLSRVLEAMDKLELGSLVSEIMMGDPNDVEIILTDGIWVRLGQAIDMDKKMLWLKSDDIKDTITGFSGGILDLSTPSKPVFYSDEN